MKCWRIFIMLLLMGCSVQQRITYKVYAQDYAKRKVTVMETVDVKDAQNTYFAVTGLELDTTLINPFYEQRNNNYYFYVEKKINKTKRNETD